MGHYFFLLPLASFYLLLLCQVDFQPLYSDKE